MILIGIACMLTAPFSPGCASSNPDQAPPNREARATSPERPEDERTFEVQQSSGEERTTNGPSSSPGSAAASGAASVADDKQREDGRPEWWFSEVQREGNRIRLCAEAIVYPNDSGRGMLEARRAAVEAGRRRVAYELGLDPDSPALGETVERTWIWPLTGQQREKPGYVGYVLISADAPR